MIDLKNCTFIIPVRIESEDRMRNVITVLCYLLENFDTKAFNLRSKEVFWAPKSFFQALGPKINEIGGKPVKSNAKSFTSGENQ